MKDILKVENVTKIYGKKTVLDNVSFSIKEGEIVGLVGPNGAGKTTVMKIITGLTPKYEGNVYIGNENIRNKLKKVFFKGVKKNGEYKNWIFLDKKRIRNNQKCDSSCKLFS